MQTRPKFLFFQEEALDYVHEYTGNLEISRLLANDAYWKKTSATDKPKTLILADWTARHWPAELQGKIHHLMANLLNEGFTIYIWQQDQLVPLTKDSLHLITQASVKNKMRLTSDDEIQKKAATQYRIPKEQIQILDDHTLETLFNTEKT